MSPTFAGQLGSLSLKLRSNILGVIMDSGFNLTWDQLLKSSTFFPGRICKLWFVSSRIDYCNSLYIDLPQIAVGAKFLTGERKRDYVTPVLHPYTGFLLNSGFITKFSFMFPRHN